MSDLEAFKPTRSGPKIPAADYSEGGGFFGFEEKMLRRIIELQRVNTSIVGFTQV